ncbi:MAG: CBS domain-containing protein [Nitrospirota bacterium]|jgi:CBS domain-containing membrane protein
MAEKSPEKDFVSRLDISDQDVFDAMRETEGFLDITPADFKELYRLAFRHAAERVLAVKARDIMTRQVHSVRPDAPLKEVAETLARTGVAGVPVVGEGGKVEGVVSEKDFLALMGGEGAGGFMGIVSECLKGKGCVAVPARKMAARDVMSSPAVTVREETALTEIAAVFTERGMNRVPVVDGEGRLVGIVSRADVVGAFLRRGG